MSGLRFERSVGAGADVKELEYVIALQQTSEETRANATVSSMDIVALLQSRHSLTISHEQAIELVRRLGGGDTSMDRIYPLDDDDDDARSKSCSHSKKLSHLMHQAVDGIQSVFHHHHTPSRESTGGGEGSELLSREMSREQGTSLMEAPSPSRPSHSNEILQGESFTAANATHPTTTTTTKLDRLSTATSHAMSSTMKRLRRLHALNRHPPGGKTHSQDHHMATLTKDVAAELRARVVEKTQSAQHLAAAANDDDASPPRTRNHTQKSEPTTTETMEITFVESSHAKSSVVEVSDVVPDFTWTQSTQTDDSHRDELPHVQPSVFFESSPPTNNDDKEEEEVDPPPDDEPTRHREDSELLPEYLDLVQILSTMLIPKFARLAYETRTNTTKTTTTTSPEIGTDEADEAEQQPESTLPKEEDEEEPGLWGKLQNRFVAYGRRKLHLDQDDDLPSFSAHEVLDMGRQALLKTIPGEEAPVLDETLVQLFLLVNGEIERANDLTLVREMVQVAQSPSGRFDETSLLRAISSDLSAWDPTCTDTPTTFFYDVFGVPLPSIKTKLQKEDDNDAPNNNKEGVEKVPRENHANVPEERADQPQQVEAPGEPSRDEGDPTTPQAEPEEPETDKPSLWSRVCRCLFPIYYSCRHDKLEFSTAFLGIDMVIDLSISLIVYTLIWVSYILIATVYAGIFIKSQVFDRQCSASSTYWCMISETVYSWLIIACLLIAVGMFHILPISVGNNPADQSARRQGFAFTFTMINTLVPYCIVNWVQRNLDDVVRSSDVKSDLDYQFYGVLQNLTLAVGCALAFMFLLQGTVMLFVDRDHPHKLPKFLQFLTTSTSWDAETRVYRAAQFKINKIVTNALRLHKSDELGSAVHTEQNLTLSTKMALAHTRDETSRNFVTHGETKEEVGGIIWTFWKACDGSLFYEEGLWISTRLWVIQVTQVGMSAVGFALFFVATVRLAQIADDFREDLESDVDLPDWVMDIFPTGEMIETAFIPATFVALVVKVFLIIVYVPSSMATVLKYRGKLLPSLGSPYFQRFRKGVDMTYMNTANAIYGLLGSALLVYFVVGLIIFLFVWPYTQDIALLITAWGIGLSITIGIKMLVTGACRKAQYRAYYRIKPAAARVSGLASEVWYIGLAGSVLIARVTQFLAAALFWVGRIDVPYLSRDVVLFGYGFDLVPDHFFKDLLVHEAHRHPYIEQLTQMYLMQLRHGDKFVNNACTAWRQLLILAIMPWLTKYRVFLDERRVAAEFEAEFEVEREEDEQDPYRGVKQMQGGVTEVGHEVAQEVVEVGEELYGAGTDIADEMGKMVKNGAQMTTEAVRSLGTFPIHEHSDHIEDENEVTEASHNAPGTTQK